VQFSAGMKFDSLLTPDMAVEMMLIMASGYSSTEFLKALMLKLGK